MISLGLFGVILLSDRVVRELLGGGLVMVTVVCVIFYCYRE